MRGDDAALVVHLERAVAGIGVGAVRQVVVEAEGVGRFPQEMEAAVYFCVLEALQNVAKYAEASRATVRLRGSADELRFEVEDDGRGFDTAATGYGTGVQGMADRLAALGGELRLVSELGSGTTVVGTLPVGSMSGRRAP